MLRKILSLVAVIALAIGIFSPIGKAAEVRADSTDFDCVYSAGDLDRVHNSSRE